MTRGTVQLLALVFLLLGVLTRAGQAQIDETTDILTGVVVGPDGTPLINATVEVVSLESGISRSTQTDRRGRYTILFPDGGGQYRVTARFIGMVPQTVTLTRYADDDRLEWNVRMTSQAVMLDEIVVRGVLTPVRVVDRATPGSTGRNLTPEALAALPIETSDLNVLATLVPGVVGIAATDSTSAAFSVGGQRADANRVTLDGMSFGSGSVPQDGLRNTRVITGTYDVSRGRFSGGLIAATTRSGSNAVQMSGTYALRDDALAFEPAGSSPFGSAFTQHQISAGAGGPLIHNRLFVFGSVLGRFRTDPLATLTSTTADDLTRLGIAPDSVARFVSLVDQLGAGPTTRLNPDRTNRTVSSLIRVDYLVSGNHTLTLRGDVRRTRQDPTRLGLRALPETGGDNESTGGGLLASLSSRLGTRFINQFRVYRSTSDRATEPYADLPRGQVQVVSDLPDGTVGVSTLSFGGNPGMPTSSRSRNVEIADELSWLPGTGRHRIKLGGSFSASTSDDVRTRNQFGTYTFNSLSALAAGRPSLFRRTLAPDERSTTAIDYAVYAGDVWRPSSHLQLTWGVRLDGSRFPNAPAYNPALDSAFGRRTDRLPAERFLSPRAGFTWSVGGGPTAGPPTIVVRGGTGLFRSTISPGLAGQAQRATGFSDAETEITCAGANVPFPGWSGLAADPAAIPTACLGGPTSGPAGRAPSATVFGHGFGAAKSWTSSIGIQRNLTSLLRLSVDARYTRGFDQYGYRDLNLDTTPRFTLADEGARPVFVDARRIAPGTGRLSLTNSRRVPGFSEVLEIGSDLASEAEQISVSLGGVTGSGIVFQTAYTWSRVRDQASAAFRFAGGGLGTTNTSGNPNIREWARSDQERRHSFLTTVSYPFGTDLEVTAIGRLFSGIPYTPLVGSDINGDGARNDRAFVFDPAASVSPTVAAGMTDLLASASGGTRSCLENQLGRVARRNSCTGPWFASLDFQVNYRPAFLGLGRRLSVSLVTLNLLPGLDQLLHGADNTRGWGVPIRPDGTLLFVTGFDPVTRTYAYQVNERFGASRAAANPLRNPFQLGIQVRLNLGPDRVRNFLDRLRGGRGAGRRGGGGVRPAGGRRVFGGGAGRGGFTPADFLERFSSLAPNPATIALEMGDSLHLTADQVTRLTPIADSLRTTFDSLAAGLRRDLEEMGTNQDPRAMLGAIRPALQDARRATVEALRLVHDILAEDQWGQLPESIRRLDRRRPGEIR